MAVDHDAGEHVFKLRIDGVPLTYEQEGEILEALKATLAKELAKLDFEGDRKALVLEQVRGGQTAGPPG